MMMTHSTKHIYVILYMNFSSIWIFLIFIQIALFYVISIDDDVWIEQCRVCFSIVFCCSNSTLMQLQWTPHRIHPISPSLDGNRHTEHWTVVSIECSWHRPSCLSLFSARDRCDFLILLAHGNSDKALKSFQETIRLANVNEKKRKRENRNWGECPQKFQGVYEKKWIDFFSIKCIHKEKSSTFRLELNSFINFCNFPAAQKKNSSFDILKHFVHFFCWFPHHCCCATSIGHRDRSSKKGTKKVEPVPSWTASESTWSEFHSFSSSELSSTI